MTKPKFIQSSEDDDRQQWPRLAPESQMRFLPFRFLISMKWVSHLRDRARDEALWTLDRRATEELGSDEGW